MFTANWCPPCKKFKNEELPKLKSSKWKVGDADTNHIKIVDIDQKRAEWSRVSKQTGKNGVPLFVLMKDGKIISYKSGFRSSVELAEWYNDN